MLGSGEPEHICLQGVYHFQPVAVKHLSKMHFDSDTTSGLGLGLDTSASASKTEVSTTSACGTFNDLDDLLAEAEVLATLRRASFVSGRIVTEECYFLSQIPE